MLSFGPAAATDADTFDQSFSLDGTPDPRMGFDKDEKFVSIALDIDDYNELYICCLKFAVPLGAAQLN
tara:strand:+ start:211 stop:414 length:204 start_codon:yes stop_codon:yes gene_type:complete